MSISSFLSLSEQLLIIAGEGDRIQEDIGIRRWGYKQCSAVVSHMAWEIITMWCPCTTGVRSELSLRFIVQLPLKHMATDCLIIIEA